MLLKTVAFSDEERIAEFKALAKDIEWQDGRKTAGAIAREVKRNLQAPASDAAAKKMREKLLKIILANAVVNAAARPRHISQLIISKTSDGGHYGRHVDNAMMTSGKTRIRTDVSFTIFLSPPEDYEGGELVIHRSGSVQKVKGQLGEIFLYPSSSIHEVLPVTSGERIACVGWMESLVADPIQRETLFDMENLRSTLIGKLGKHSPEILALDKIIGGIVRMWSIP